MRARCLSSEAMIPKQWIFSISCVIHSMRRRGPSAVDWAPICFPRKQNCILRGCDIAHLKRQVNELSPLREEFEKFQSHVVKLENLLAENENEIGYLNARANEVSALQDERASTQTRLLELEAIVADKLVQIETLQNMHEADQKRIVKFGAMIETLWANEFRQKNELCQLEQQVAQLKIEREKLASELDTIKEGLGWRIRRRLGLLITKSP